MFRTSFEAPSASAPPDFFLLPPAAGRTLEAGLVIEDVRLARDEMANMAFGIERITASDIGEPRPGPERDAAVKSGVISPPSPATPPATPLRYRAGTTGPVHWIPLLPVQVAGGADGEVALEKRRCFTRRREIRWARLMTFPRWGGCSTRRP
jgi:hypothetical protein